MVALCDIGPAIFIEYLRAVLFAQQFVTCVSTVCIWVVSWRIGRPAVSRPADVGSHHHIDSLFVYPTVGLVANITNGCVSWFLGAELPHCTSLIVASSPDRGVWYPGHMLEDWNTPYADILAWGGGGSSDTTTVGVARAALRAQVRERGRVVQVYEGMTNPMMRALISSREGDTRGPAAALRSECSRLQFHR